MRLTRATRAAAAVLTTVVTTVALCAAGARALPTVVVHDPDSVAWLSLRDQTGEQFATSVGTYSDAGYRIVDLDIDVTGTDYRVGSVWQRNTDHRAWQEQRDLTDTEFQAAVADSPLRLVEQETYQLAGVRRWAGVWLQNVEGLEWTASRDLTGTELARISAEQRGAGRMPIDLDEYDTGQGPRYAVIWVQNVEGLDWQLWHDLSSNQFTARFSQVQRGYRMLAFESVETPAGQRYAGIWVANPSGRGWAQRRDLTGTGFANWWNRYRDEGYRLVGLNRYQTAAGTRYAGIWRQNSDRPDWVLRRKVDTRIQAELDRTGVPGISVAVFYNGQPKYLRGFGYADIGAGVWMDSRQVGGIASVSKAVAGVLTMRMVEQGLVQLTEKTRDLVPEMPAQHTHTLGQLVSNRGCVGHYDEIDDSRFADRVYPSALAAAKEFWDKPLACRRPAYHYSTHGYTLLGAALEAAGGQDIESLIRSELTDPFQLGTLAPQDLSDTSVRRMAIYTAGDVEIPIPNNDWKTLGGGMESSAYDLGRFGAELAAGHILTRESLHTLWTAPDKLRPYAYGWDVGTEHGHRVVAKDGSWVGTLAYLRIYPNDGIVVAVLMNDRSGDQSAARLGQDIGRLVLSAVS